MGAPKGVKRVAPCESWPANKACPPGHRSRCSSCGHVLILSPSHKLSDGTQIYHWTDRQDRRKCPGRSSGDNVGSPEHKPRRLERKT